MPSRFTMLMQITTNPANRDDASPHTGGWSESFWGSNPIVASDPTLITLMQKRAILLPAQGSIVGFRIGNYNITGNRLVPTGSSTGKVLYAGNGLRQSGLPQKSLSMTGVGHGVANCTRFTIRGIPDSQLINGEYQPDAGYKSAVTAFGNELSNAGWKFLGRDLTRVSQSVQAIAGNVVTLGGAIGAVAGTDYLRFRRVYDDDGDPVTGAYLITAIAGNNYTLAGFPARTLTSPSGTARVDAIALVDFFSVTPSRAVVRKIGRPFESYRGRQSKRGA